MLKRIVYSVLILTILIFRGAFTRLGRPRYLIGKIIPFLFVDQHRSVMTFKSLMIN